MTDEHVLWTDPTKPGPWFAAMWDGRCSRCGHEIEVGQRIRADGEGSWECCDGEPGQQEVPLGRNEVRCDNCFCYHAGDCP